MKDINGIEEPINPATGRRYNRYRRYERERDLELLSHVKNIVINQIQYLEAAVPGYGEEGMEYIHPGELMKDLIALKNNILHYKYHGGMATSEVIEKMEAVDE